jgi:tetratricopeptide (TPR) repeat protein
MPSQDPHATLQVLARRGRECRERGQYLEAEALYEQTLVVAETCLEKNDLELANLFNDAAVLYKYVARLDDARRLYLRASRILKANFGHRNHALASIYHNMGGLEHARGRYARAEVFARHSAAIREKSCGPEHPDVAADSAALAAILEGQGKYEEAESLYKRALSVFEKQMGPEHYEIAVNLNNLGSLNYALKRIDDSERFFRRASAMKEKLLGPEHPEVAVTLNNLAIVCQSRGKHEEAENLYKRCLCILKKVLRPDHPKITACLTNYARLVRKVD